MPGYRRDRVRLRQNLCIPCRNRRLAPAWQTVYLSFRGSLLAFDVLDLAALGTACFCRFTLPAKSSVGHPRRNKMLLLKEARVGRLVEDLMKGSEEYLSA